MSRKKYLAYAFLNFTKYIAIRILGILMTIEDVLISLVSGYHPVTISDVFSVRTAGSTWPSSLANTECLRSEMS
jgi:hypothetical protein